MRKNLQHIKIDKSEVKSQNLEQKKNLLVQDMELKSYYSQQDIQDLKHLDFGAGFAPNLRGIDTMMYVQKPWKTYKYTSFEIDSLEDMKKAIDQFSIDGSMTLKTTTDSILPLVAFYIIAAEEKNIKPEQLSLTIENDFSKNSNNPEYHKESLKIITDILEYTNKKILGFNSISISGYPNKKTEISIDSELAYAFTFGIEIIKMGLTRGMTIDELASRLSFTFDIRMNHFLEIAKMRAARIIWATLIKQFNPKDNKSFRLRINSQTSTYNFSQKDSYNNVTRICTEAIAAVFGGTQSLQTKDFNEDLELQNEAFSRIARNTQFFLQKETKINNTVDPWGGSFYVESLTNEIIQNTWKRIEELECITQNDNILGIKKIK